MMEYRLNKETLGESLAQWNKFLKARVRLIACGGTALTLLDIKPSTKDIDFLVPDDAEYRYLIKTLQDLGYHKSGGYGWRREGELYSFDLFPGKRIHTTELIDSPLEEGRHFLFKKFSRLYIGILNYYDLIASKLFRGAGVDFEDCLMLLKARRGEIDPARLIEHFKELASYDVAEDRVLGHLDSFIRRVNKDNDHDG